MQTNPTLRRKGFLISLLTFILNILWVLNLFRATLISMDNDFMNLPPFLPWLLCKMHTNISSCYRIHCIIIILLRFDRQPPASRPPGRSPSRPPNIKHRPPLTPDLHRRRHTCCYDPPAAWFTRRWTSGCLPFRGSSIPHPLPPLVICLVKRL